MPAFRSLPLLAAILWCMGSPLTAGAQDFPPPQGEVILTITGAIAHTNVDDTAQFDREMLEGLGMAEVTTGTPWFDGVKTFAGPPLAAVLDRVGAKGRTIKAVALNDYETDIPLSDAKDTGVILAMKMNGDTMTVRDKGPLFVIYPYDSAPRFETQTYYSRSAWQVTRLIIR
ncbi:molybdopterin-dependent oxidoreductase [Falsirhodobacter sp. 20TX0035]|uniref:molybdopterin-dependent oxidoreductase n=1 Tax=Falsirhodobacter sp. 20TX0035 TaxID=3022019 RepID=UPI00232DEF6A|nr:molybdopterin-dependent oxidoreductase [Falsirhodobacter sp. 20TX0035]MDB6455219.1 molybdopterin-dependent oxidoreductase [Falsirhodobacter sp. 20TX0035]